MYSELVLLLDLLTSGLDPEFIFIANSTILASLNLVIGKESFAYPSAVHVATGSRSISTATHSDTTFTLPIVAVTVGEDPLDVTRCTTIKRASMSMAEQGAETVPVQPMLSDLGLNLEFRKEKYISRVVI